MSPEKKDPAYLWDVLVAAKTITEFTQGLSWDDYLRNAMVRHAVERNLGIIGEAARHVSEVFRQAHPDVPWRSIVGLRNIVVHEYDNVDHAIIWEVIRDDIPDLMEKLEALAPSVPPENRG